MVAQLRFFSIDQGKPSSQHRPNHFLASSLCEARQHTDSWAHKPRPFFSWPRALKSDHKPTPFRVSASSPASNYQQATRTSLSRPHHPVSGLRRRQISTSSSLHTNRPRLRAKHFPGQNANKYHPRHPNDPQTHSCRSPPLIGLDKALPSVLSPKVAHHLPTPRHLKPPNWRALSAKRSPLLVHSLDQNWSTAE